MAKDQSTTEKIVMIGLSLAAGWAAQKAVEKIWDKTTGGLSHNIDDDDARIASVVTFAAVSAVAASVTQIVAKRSSRRVVTKFRPKN
ncbi:DUF4235 domain-containing protein [Jonesia quinghaiensis]|uniref:DUF4235 domain-containing protein n=1 Tax=Jonesia quinghaiensis TaxID=262806 RepID=UPI000405B31B|nr:DUF4235 domain-containing protein [Jonesia quinghaiensis]